MRAISRATIRDPISQASEMAANHLFAPRAVVDICVDRYGSTRYEQQPRKYEHRLSPHDVIMVKRAICHPEMVPNHY